MMSRDALWCPAFSEGGYCTAGTVIEFLKFIDSSDLSKAREAAESMSQWALTDNHVAATTYTGPGAGSIESAVRQALAQVVKSAQKPQQDQSAGSAAVHNASARRGGRHIRQRGGRQGSTSKAAEKGLIPEVSSHDPSGVQDMIEALQAERGSCMLQLPCLALTACTLQHPLLRMSASSKNTGMCWSFAQTPRVP